MSIIISVHGISRNQRLPNWLLVRPCCSNKLCCRFAVILLLCEPLLVLWLFDPPIIPGISSSESLPDESRFLSPPLWKKERKIIFKTIHDTKKFVEKRFLVTISLDIQPRQSFFIFWEVSPKFSFSHFIHFYCPSAMKKLTKYDNFNEGRKWADGDKIAHNWSSLFMIFIFSFFVDQFAIALSFETGIFKRLVTWLLPFFVFFFLWTFLLFIILKKREQEILLQEKRTRNWWVPFTKVHARTNRMFIILDVFFFVVDRFFAAQWFFSGEKRRKKLKIEKSWVYK